MSSKTSRREFLHTASGSIALSWGGLRIFGGPEAFARATPQPLFVYGAYWNRPPGPPASERRGIIQTMAEKYRFNTLRIWSSWDYSHFQPDHFDFAELDELMGYCDTFGLKTMITISLENAPYWLEAAYPETRYVDANDRPRHLRGIGHHISGGYPGLCLDWPPVREAAARFIQQTAKVVSAHRSRYAYDCWNEPHAEPISEVPSGAYCYCSKTLAIFREWLQQRYGTLDKLNEIWTRRYPSWETVEPPRALGTYLDWVDWNRFMIDKTTAELRFRAENLRAVDAHSVLESHSVSPAAVMDITVLGINPWRLAEIMETWGASFYPRWFALPIYKGAAQLELTRSQAGGKPFWMAEMQGGPGLSGGNRNAMRPQDIRLWNWMGVATGSKGVIFEKYRTELTGSESGGLALLAPDGSTTERALEAADVGRRIQAHWDLLKDYRPRADVALLFDADCAVLTFAMNGNETVSTDSFSGYYKALWNCDLWADFIEPKALPGNSYKVVIVPWHPMLRKETGEQLRRFVEGGGTLILETGFGMYDEHALLNPVLPPYGLAEVFGYREGESFYLPIPGEAANPAVKTEAIPASERVYTQGHLDFTDPIAVTVKAHTHLTPLTVSTATVIAKYESTPVAIKNKLGRGQVYYIGTSLGASIESGDQGGVDLLRAILTETVQPLVTAHKVRPRLIEGAAKGLLVVVNEGAEDEQSAIKLPPRYQRSTDLYSGEKQRVQNNFVTAAVPFQGVSVLLLE